MAPVCHQSGTQAVCVEGLSRRESRGAGLAGQEQTPYCRATGQRGAGAAALTLPSRCTPPIGRREEAGGAGWTCSGVIRRPVSIARPGGRRDGATEPIDAPSDLSPESVGLCAPRSGRHNRSCDGCCRQVRASSNCSASPRACAGQVLDSGVQKVGIALPGRAAPCLRTWSDSHPGIVRRSPPWPDPPWQGRATVGTARQAGRNSNQSKTALPCVAYMPMTRPVKPPATSVVR